MPFGTQAYYFANKVGDFEVRFYFQRANF